MCVLCARLDPQGRKECGRDRGLKEVIRNTLLRPAASGVVCLFVCLPLSAAHLLMAQERLSSSQLAAGRAQTDQGGR
jgi:hypothetical protein